MLNCILILQASNWITLYIHHKCLIEVLSQWTNIITQTWNVIPHYIFLCDEKGKHRILLNKLCYNLLNHQKYPHSNRQWKRQNTLERTPIGVMSGKQGNGCMCMKMKSTCWHGKEPWLVTTYMQSPSSACLHGKRPAFLVPSSERSALSSGHRKLPCLDKQ